ncbi:glycosyltransferase [Dokdonella soli]|uniref:Glycosyltransferase family 2 protein n=1 Tax=Dokdonella soli TaxID=529810 RepID=A0ABN1IGZ5_9GAMM
MRTSLVIITYNWPQALELVLHSVARQSRLPDEVIVTDDGSRDETRLLIARIAQHFPCRLVHLWQEDLGFRAARARNRAIAAARGDYIILIDGDMLLHKHFVADHLLLAAPGKFFQGTRLRATEAETRRLLDGGKPRFDMRIDATFRPSATDRQKLHYGKRYYAFRSPLLARLMARSRRGGHVMSCNMGFWRRDLLAINGFDERMEGYGSEDLELAARARNAGLRHSQLKFAGLAIHLEHGSRAPADPDDPTLPNNRILRETVHNRTVRCDLGIDRYLAEFAEPPADVREIRNPA